MKLPSHVLTKLFVAGAVGTVGVVVLLQPMRPKAECQPCEAVVEVPIEMLSVEDDSSESLLEIVRRQNLDPLPILAPLPPPPPVQQTPRPQPQMQPKPKPPRTFVSSCGHLVPAHPSGLVKACGKG